MRTALVTGSSRGIGRATAVALAEAGLPVVLTARGRDDLEDAAEAVTSAGGEARVERCDFADPDAIDGLFDRLETDGIEVDVLVNNVGVARMATFEEVDDEEWQLNWSINVMSAVRVGRRAIPGMARRGRGRVVNVSSSAGKRPSSRWAAYAPTKAALQALTIVWARTYGEAGIRVNAVCPGPVKTPMWTARDGLWREVADDRAEALERVGEKLPVGRMGEPEEVAAAIAFLCGESASWIHGAVLSVDGGNVGIVL